MMDPTLKNKWITALTSGEYRQARGKLCCMPMPEDEESAIGYCCLGVLIDVANPDLWEENESGDGLGVRTMMEDGYGDQYEEGIEEAEFPVELKDEFGLTDSQVSELISMNDGGPHQTDTQLFGKGVRLYSFDEIAQWIEENL